jgi:hypothetical protein
VNPQLVPWGNFYVIVGSSAAALIGIQFVVIALVANMRQITTADTIHAFATPTVVHLGGALVVSALMCAPWTSLSWVSIALAMCGLGGLGYASMAIRLVRRQTGYKPVREDWIWHAVLPWIAFAVLAMAALLLRTIPRTALFVVGAAALGLLLIAIHNAWDSVTHIVVTAVQHDASKKD